MSYTFFHGVFQCVDCLINWMKPKIWLCFSSFPFWDLIVSKVPRSDTIYSMGIEWLSPVSISVSRAPLFAKGWHSMSLRGQFCQIWWQPLRRLMTYRGKEWNCKDGPDGVVTEPRIRLALLWPNRPPYNRLNTQYPDHILDLPTYSSRAMIVWLLEITAGLYAAVSVYVEINREGSKVRGSH